MWKLILVFSCLYSIEVLSLAVEFNVPAKIFYELEYAKEHFQDFIKKYEKNYDIEELEHRLEVFVKNLEEINRLNHENPDVVYGINAFSDLTFEEFANVHTCLSGSFTNENVINYVPKGMAPDSLDYRQKNLVTKVKNQGNCGSCYIFSAIGNIEGQYAKRYGQLISLSEQQGLDCGSNGCHSGMPHEVMEALAKSGCMKESDYPYVGKQGQCHANQSEIVVKVSGVSQLAIASEDDLKDALANYGPLSVAMFTNGEFHKYHGGVFTTNNYCGSKGHAVLLVGYGTDGGKPYWLAKNSWGSNWGEQGYFRIARGQNVCDFGWYVASAQVA